MPVVASNMSVRRLIMVPTYNEKSNVERLIGAINDQNLDTDLLFVDDNSPDGTGQILEKIKEKNPRLKVLHREGKQGIGSAHKFGIRWAYDNGYDELITMDCDFTHPPEYLKVLIKKAKEENDIVVGSRYLDRNSLNDWNPYRKFLTKLGHFTTRILLKMPYDATTGFRLYKLKNIPKDMWNLVVSEGYSFFFESLFVLNFNKFTIDQFPMVLPSRTYGHSKMNIKEIFNSIKLLFALYATAIFNREKITAVEAFPENMVDQQLTDLQGWDGYWNAKYNSSRVLYDVIAAIYRKYIIKPSLNHFLRKYFRTRSSILHAGCGGGQVDVDVSKDFSITGLDISVNALNLYRCSNGRDAHLVHGSIFKMPLTNASQDGIYNLGVMEHFEEDQIRMILREFYRVLKPGGRIILFWPPEFGLSVIFFKVLTFIFKKILRRQNVKFHPDEITRIRSKKHLNTIFNENLFKLIRYNFGIRDFFTYLVIVADKEELPHSS